MARFISDQNQLGFLYESGTYGTASGTNHWIGLVQNSVPAESTGIIQTRYTGTGDRNVDALINGPLDFPGTFTYFPQDWKFLVFAMGSNVDAGSPSPFSHTISEQNNASISNAFTSGPLNPWLSFTLEEAQQDNPTGLNFIRTFNGCVVDSMTISASQGEIYTVEVNYIAQTATFTSGAVTSLTETTTRPFLWSDTQLHIPSGTVYDALLDLSWTINNNMLAPHYLNGSREISVPVPENREYELSVTFHGTSQRTKTLYETNFLGGSLFNAMLEVTAAEAGAGSRDMFMVMSGCKILSMDAPSPMEGTNEQSITIILSKCSAVANDLVEKYNAW